MKITKRSLVFLVAGLLSAGSVFATSPEKIAKRAYKDGDRIVVIGAGVGGLAVVRGLVESGVPAEKITVIDKSGEIGGKVDTVKIPGDERVYELGATMIVPGGYAEIEALAKEHGVEPVRINNGTKEYLNPEENPANWSAEDQKKAADALTEEFGRYLQTYVAKWSSIANADGYKEIPEVLKQSWNDFIETQHFKTLNNALASLVAGSGNLLMGRPTEASLIVRLLNKDFMMGLRQNGIRFFAARGYQKLWELEAKKYEKMGVKFLLKSMVREIDRKEEFTMVRIIGKKPVKAEHVFFTANLAYLPKLMKNPSEEEKELYGRVETYDYRSYLVRIRGLKHEKETAAGGIYPNMLGGDEGLGRPAVLVKPYADSDVYQVYLYGEDVNQKPIPHKTLVKNMKEDFKKLGATFVQPLEWRRWQYFPHPRNDVEGFFNSVMDQQGKGGVWVTGEALSFAMTIEVYKQGLEFAKRMAEGTL